MEKLSGLAKILAATLLAVSPAIGTGGCSSFIPYKVDRIDAGKIKPGISITRSYSKEDSVDLKIMLVDIEDIENAYVADKKGEVLFKLVENGELREDMEKRTLMSGGMSVEHFKRLFGLLPDKERIMMLYDYSYDVYILNKPRLDEREYFLVMVNKKGKQIIRDECPVIPPR